MLIKIQHDNVIRLGFIVFELFIGDNSSMISVLAKLTKSFNISR
jgi:hypothetical protein